MSQGKVVHVVTSLDFGGVEKHLETYAKFSHLSKWRPIFIAIGNGGRTQERIMKMGFEVFLLGLKPENPSIKSIIKLYGLLTKIRPDVVHTHGSEANFNGLIAAYLAGVPVRVAEEIGIPSHSKRAIVAFRLVYLLSSKVIAISDSVKSWLVSNGEVHASKVVKIYNPVEDNSRIGSENSERDNFDLTLSFVGRLEPVKNPLSLIRALPLLNFMGVSVRLYLVGDGSLKNECNLLCSDLNISNQVELVGYSSEPHSFIRKSDIYIQPSISEGFGIALVEAMLCGVPALASSVGGAPEIISHGENGWLIEDTNPDSLAKAIYAIWKDRESLSIFKKNAHESVFGRFAPSKYIVELDELYIQTQNN